MTGLDRRLPPKWDGHRVNWGNWWPMPLSVCWKLPNQCEICGASVPPQSSIGHVQGLPIMLALLRCGNCGYTSVFDGKEFWELDEDDYLPDGSYA